MGTKFNKCRVAMAILIANLTILAVALLVCTGLAFYQDPFGALVVYGAIGMFLSMCWAGTVLYNDECE